MPLKQRRLQILPGLSYLIAVRSFPPFKNKIKKKEKNSELDDRYDFSEYNGAQLYELNSIQFYLGP